MDQIKLLLVDTDTQYREKLRTKLDKEENMHVVGEVDSYDTMKEFVQHTEVHVILIDSKISGIREGKYDEIIKPSIKNGRPKIGTVMLLETVSYAHVLGLLPHNVNTFVVKSEKFGYLCQAITAVHLEGGYTVSPAVFLTFGSREEITIPGGRLRVPGGPGLRLTKIGKLTGEELEFLFLLCRGDIEPVDPALNRGHTGKMIYELCFRFEVTTTVELIEKAKRWEFG